MHLEPVNQKLLQQLKPEEVEVDIVRAEVIEKLEETGVEESERSGNVELRGPRKLILDGYGMRLTAGLASSIAYVFGRRKDQVFIQLKQLLIPFGIQKFCTDGWGAYERHLSTENHEVGKRKTQRIERKHLRLRTRIKRLTRKTICFSLVGVDA